LHINLLFAKIVFQNRLKLKRNKTKKDSSPSSQIILALCLFLKEVSATNAIKKGKTKKSFISVALILYPPHFIGAVDI